MKNINVIIDGDYLMRRIIHANLNYKGEPFLNKKSDKQIYLNNLTSSFLNIFKHIPKFNKVIFVRDSRSWRYDIYSEYKLKRVKDEKINWEEFTKMYDHFCELLSRNNINVSRINKAEGDDLLYLWSRYFLSINESSIIVSGDKDIHQLVCSNDNGFVIVYGNNTKNTNVVIDNRYYETIIESKYGYNKSYLDNIRNAKKFINSITSNDGKLIEVDIDKFLLIKVLTGDSGDNINSIFTWTKNTKRGLLNYNISEKKSTKIIDEIGEATICNIKDNINIVQKHVEKISKLKVNKYDLLDSINLNNKLMVLSYDNIPDSIIKSFNDIDMSKLTINSKLISNSLNKDQFLESSKYRDIQNNVFKGVETSVSDIDLNEFYDINDLTI